MKLPNTLRSLHPARPSGVIAAIGAVSAALAALAAANAIAAKRSERRHPPKGKFIEVDGVRLHYLEAGRGPPIVLIHGNGVSSDNYVLSGIFDRLAKHNRVIAFDRPGFGYSSRPRSRIWTARAQAEVIGKALTTLDFGPAVVIAHSWGVLVALNLALERPDSVRGLGLMSGYYWPTPRLDVPMMSGPAIPVFGDILRFTLSPPLGWLIAPLVFKHIFSPAKVTRAFKQHFPTSMSLRPSQIRASAADTAMMPFEAMRLPNAIPRSRVRSFSSPARATRWQASSTSR